MDVTRLREILELLSCEPSLDAKESQYVGRIRAALSKLEPTDKSQDILKRSGGETDVEKLKKVFSAPSARPAAAILSDTDAKAGSGTGNAAIICPSVLASDFSQLGAECERVLKLGADWLHMDVMDGHFVPNLTFGAPILRSLRKRTQGFLDCHLMVSEPEKWVLDFKSAGVESFCFHLEAAKDPADLIAKVKAAGMRVGIALKPDTKAEAVFPYCDSLDHVLVMTVEPGFGGQKFMWWMMPKVAALRQRFPSLNIQVDGGVKPHTVGACALAGANLIVSGSGIYKAAKPGEAIEAMRKSVNALCKARA